MGGRELTAEVSSGSVRVSILSCNETVKFLYKSMKLELLILVLKSLCSYFIGPLYGSLYGSLLRWEHSLGEHIFEMS